MKTLITGARLLTPEIFPAKGWLLIAGGKIEDYGSGLPPEKYCQESELKNKQIDLAGDYLGPGLIDIHIHGAKGYDVMDGSFKALAAISDYKLRQGVTGYLATPLTADNEKLHRVLDNIKDYREKNPDTNLLGVHLEGPFINREKAGAQNPAHIKSYSPELFSCWQSKLKDLLKIVTLAPEIEGAFSLLKILKEQEIIAAAGHSKADYQTMQQAFSSGINHASHLFNGMLGLHHREPGTVGACLDNDKISVELIADGIHLHPAILRLVRRVKPLEQIILITDAMRAAGMEDGQYELGGLKVQIKEGEARLKESKQLAGSTISMLEAVKRFYQETDLNLQQAWQLASTNPARKLDLLETTGEIAAGKRADLVAFSADWHVRGVWQAGVLSKEDF